MAEGCPTISLLDQASERGYRASVIATYSCFLPFYEQVVLRRLVASGCTHNVLMVDAGRAADAWADEGLRPRVAGTAYSLVPVRTSGAFHPKVFIQIGPTKGALLVGSHNATIAGFGFNDELTAVFRAEPPNARIAGEPLRRVQSFLRQFVPAELPEVVEAYDEVFAGARWLGGPMPVGTQEREVLTTTGTDEPLWPRIRARLPARVRKALVVAPFFDGPLEFLQRLAADVRPDSLVVAIDPTTTAIAHDAPTRLPSATFVTVRGQSLVPGRDDAERPYLHAKALWFRGTAGEELLVLGSANASRPAFLGGAGRNAEAVVVDRTLGIGERLGLTKMASAPAMTAEDWDVVRSSRESTVRAVDSRTSVFLAVPTEDGFQVAGEIAAEGPLRAEAAGEAIGEVVQSLGMPGRILAAPAVRDAATHLVGVAGDRKLVVLVHRSTAIGEHIASDARKVLRQTLGALEEDPTQLATLIKITEKVIFDVDDAAVMDGGADMHAPDRGAVEEGASAAAVLALDARGRHVSRRRSLARGDIAYLIDALIRRLGEGTSSPVARQLVEDEVEGRDEEEGGELVATQPAELGLEQLAQTCRSKTRRLIKRMIERLREHEPRRAARTIIQLAAVLGVLRALDLIARRPEWRRRHLPLVDEDAASNLFASGVIATVGRKDALAAAAIAEAGAPFAELSVTFALLGWLAWRSGVTIEPQTTGWLERPDREVERVAWARIQLLAALAPVLVTDDDAISLWDDAVRSSPGGPDWVTAHRAWVLRIADIGTGPRPPAIKRVPRRGDLVMVAPGAVHVIVEVVPKGTDANVTVIDLVSGEQKSKTYVASKVLIVAGWPDDIAGARGAVG